MKSKVKVILVLPIIVITMATCKQEPLPEKKTATMEVRMIDAPSPYGYEQVNVDVRGVEANIAGVEADQSSWIQLNAKAGVYNLLDLVNGFDALIGEAQVPEGTLLQVRLLLGDNNSIRTINGNTYPMEVPSGSTSGLKLSVNEQITAGLPFTLYIDFDAARSVMNHGNGTFSLNPVLRAFTAAGTGSVQGGVSIPGPGIAVVLESHTAVYTAYADRHSGAFMLRGVSNGTYTLKIYPADSEVPLTVPNVEISAGKTTDVGLLILRQ
jgi:hypothetical protein